MKTRHILYPLLMALAILLPTSCSFEEDLDTSTSKGEKISFTIGVELAGASHAESRAFTETKTEKITSLHVAIFDVTADGSYYWDFVQATPSSSQDTDNCWEFSMELTKAEKAEGHTYRFHLIANYPGLTMGFGEESQLMGLLETKAGETEHDVYWNFVELESIDDNTKTSLQHVPLVRNYAKVNLAFADGLDSKFDFVAYALYNVPKKGTVAAYNSTIKFASFVNGSTLYDYDALTTAGYYGNEAYNDGSLFTNVWKENESTAPFYIYERKNKDADNPTCMIIKANYDNAETYYKLDFVNANGEYYNLLRNFVYTMTVTSVMGAGYGSIDEALRQPACNNISGDAVAQDFTNVSDGTHQLFVSTTSILFTQQNPVDLYYKYIPNISNGTTNNGDVTIDGLTGSVLASSTLATKDETTGQYEGWRKITLNPNAVSATAASQDLVFKAGGLQRKVTLMLNKPYEGMTVNVYDPVDNDKFVNMESGKAVKVDITLPAGIPESLFPLRLFIRSAANTIYPNYGTNMPAESQNGKYGFIKEVSYSDAYEVTYGANNKKIETPKTISCDFLTNCVNNATTVYVENQYLARAEDPFKNSWKNEVNIHSNTLVNIEKVWGRNPETIYNDGDNNGTKSVTVTLNGVNKGSITINSSQVVNGSELKIQDTEGLSQNDVVVFTFTDNYWHGQWSTTPITWQAEATLGALDNGTTLNFKAVGEIGLYRLTLNSFGAGVEVETETVKYGSTTYKVYPKNIHNSTNATQNNDGKETVYVYYSQNNTRTLLFKLVINKDRVTSLMDTTDTAIEYIEIPEVAEELVFEFKDYYCTKRERNSFTFSSNTDTYQATIQIEDLHNSGVVNKLNFTR